MAICNGEIERHRTDGLHNFAGIKKHIHYKKDVSKLEFVDVYRVLQLFDVTHPAVQHAAKKVLCAGGRGAKDWAKDIKRRLTACSVRLIWRRRMEMCKVYFREKGKTLVYQSDAKLTHAQALKHIKAYGHKPDGAVLVA